MSGIIPSMKPWYIVAGSALISLAILVWFQPPEAPPLTLADMIREINLLPRNLKLGDEGEDVRRLQVFLNEEPETQLSAEGPGSPDNETTYFGLRTLLAVKKYQEIHREKVLEPVGLSIGTGYLGPSTRKQIHFELALASMPDSSASALGPLVEGSPEASEITEALGQEEGESFQIYYADKYEGPRGTKITLTGDGFDKEGISLHFGDSFRMPIKILKNSQKFNYTIPEDAPLGKHDFWLTNGLGEETRKIIIVVTDPAVPAPIIFSTTPNKVKYGETVTIKGTGFTKTGNDIYTTYQIIRDVPSLDGETLVFDTDFFSDIPEIEMISTQNINQVLDVWYNIVNDRGQSDSGSQEHFLLEL